MKTMAKNKPPKIRLAEITPLQDRFEDGLGNYWSVARLVDAAKEFEPFECPIASLDLSHQLWGGSDMTRLAFHCKKVMEADLSKPIIIMWNGMIGDGRHRILRSIIEEKRTILAVRLIYKLEPCGVFHGK